MPKTILVVSGPSGVGKGPLVRALSAQLPLYQMELLTTRPRVQGPAEVRQGHFMGTGQLTALPADGYVVDMVRDRGYALNLNALEDALQAHDLVVLTLFYTTVQKLLAHPKLTALRARGVRVVTVFVSPLAEATIQQIERCTHLEHVLPHIMAGRQMDRMLEERADEGFSTIDVLGITLRVMTTVEEVRNRGMFAHQVVLRDGHLPRTWAADPLVGDAAVAIRKLLMILRSD